ncbi:hypothetical protein STEG23_017270, partial [Scotinomys teguina]
INIVFTLYQGNFPLQQVDSTTDNNRNQSKCRVLWKPVPMYTGNEPSNPTDDYQEPWLYLEARTVAKVENQVERILSPQEQCRTKRGSSCGICYTNTLRSGLLLPHQIFLSYTPSFELEKERSPCAWSSGKATHILALNSSSDLIVSKSIRERQLLAAECGEVSHTVPHQPCITARDSEVPVRGKVGPFHGVPDFLDILFYDLFGFGVFLDCRIYFLYCILYIGDSVFHLLYSVGYACICIS